MARIVKLGFERERVVLAGAERAFLGRRSAAVTGDDLILSSRLLFSSAETKEIEGNRTLEAILNKTLTNLGKRFVEAIQKRITALGAIKTRLFLTGWRSERFQDRAKFNNAIRLKNAAPYALYVHPKGTPKSRTIVNVDIKGNLLPKYAAELTEDIDRLRPRIAQALKLQILRDAKRAATRRR